MQNHFCICIGIFFGCLLFLSGNTPTCATPVDTTAHFTVYYPVERSDLLTHYMMNGVTLREMDKLLDSLCRADAPMNILLTSGASPEGTEDLNLTLADARNEQMRMYLLTHKRYVIRSQDLSTVSMGADWNGLALALEKSTYSWRKEALLIIRNTPVWVHDRAGNIVDSKKKQLMDLRGGNPWREMTQDIFPYLRRTEVEVTFKVDRTIPVPEPQTDTLYIHQRDTLVIEKHIKEEAPRYGFLLYTNLLYDAAAIPSIGTEIYLGKGWALNTRWSGSWWSSKKKNRFWRIYGAELAVRKYFREPSDNATSLFRSSTGHHVGAYGQLLTYDIEFAGKGYMGGKPGSGIFAAPTWSAGVEYGYTLALTRHLNLDFSIGLGYLQGPQWQYLPANGDYRYEEFRTFRWIGPTRADISLYWLIGMENKKK